MKKVFIVLSLIATTLFAQDELKLLTTVHGEKEGDMYSVVDAVGDVNGDGFDDFIVGGSSGEYVKLYFGGSPFDTLDCIRFVQGTWRRVNVSGCGKGDLNGDGYNDFVINTAYFVDDYRVEIYYGGKDKKNYDTPDLTITNNGWYYGFGGRSIIGDLNGDGYDDLVISAPNDDYDAHGRVYIYFGGKDMDTECDVFLEGKEPFDMFGKSVSIVGDVNNDGYDDLLVGAPQFLAEDKPGKAYLFFGGEEIGFDNSVEFVGTDSINASYGTSVSGLGDINNDGFKDFGIAAQDYVNIILGDNNIDSTNFFNTYTNNEISFIGGLSDFNKDSYSDYVIVRKDINIYNGASIPDTIPDIDFDFWASPVCNIGDINGDDKDEIAFGIGGGWDPSGRVEIYAYGKINDAEESFINTIPTNYIINQNYPNPFNPTTTISYTLPETGAVQIKIYDLLGREVTKLVDEQKSAGKYTIQWNGSNYASGIYFYSVTFGGQRLYKKMLMIK